MLFPTSKVLLRRVLSVVSVQGHPELISVLHQDPVRVAVPVPQLALHQALALTWDGQVSPGPGLAWEAEQEAGAGLALSDTDLYVK